MQIAKTIAAIFLTVIFSYTFLPKLAIGSATPHLILVVALIYLYQKNLATALLWIVVGESFKTLIAGGLPYNIILAAAIILLVWLVTQRFFEMSHWAIFLSLCFLSNFLYDIILFIPWGIKMVVPACLDASYSTLFAFLVLFLLQKRIKRQYQIEVLGGR
jgi:hypothetical protein